MTRCESYPLCSGTIYFPTAPILRLDTMYLAVLNLFYIDRSANLDFASLHLGLGVRPINSPTNVLV